MSIKNKITEATVTQTLPGLNSTLFNQHVGSLVLTDSLVQVHR